MSLSNFEEELLKEFEQKIKEENKNNKQKQKFEIDIKTNKEVFFNF